MDIPERSKMSREAIFESSTFLLEDLTICQEATNGVLAKLFELAGHGYNILFVDETDHNTAKFVEHNRIFTNHTNPEHMRCVLVILDLLGREAFDRTAAKKLIAAIHEKDVPSYLETLVALGIDPLKAYHEYLGPLESLLY